MEDLINKLPDDCLRHIFSFLNISKRLEIEKVCKRWHSVGEKGWPDKIEMRFYDISDKEIHAILKRCGCFLRKLKIELSPKNPLCLLMINHFCRLEKLESIKIRCESDSIEELEIQNLRKFFEKAKNLTVIKIYGDLEEYWMDYVNLVNPTTLRELAIKNEGKQISFNPDRFPNLKKLTLEYILIEKDETRSEKDSLKDLEIFNIKDSHIPGDLIQRIQNFTNLRDLFLKDNICDISNNDIRVIANNCDKIKEMRLMGTPSLTSDCFQYLGKMPLFDDLYLNSLNIVNNLDIVHLTNVRELGFNYCPCILMEDGLIQLITRSSNLERLMLTQNSDFDPTFINDVQLIFHCGMKQKHLDFTAWIDYSDRMLSRPSPIEIDEHLLSLAVYYF